MQGEKPSLLQWRIEMESFLFLGEKCYPAYNDTDDLAGCINDDNMFIDCRRCLEKNICPQYNKINHPH